MKLRTALLTVALTFGATVTSAQESANWHWRYDVGQHCTPCIGENWRAVHMENSERAKVIREYIEENKNRIIHSQTDEERRSHEGVLELVEQDIMSDATYSDIDRKAKRSLRNRPTILDKLLAEFKDNVYNTRMTVSERRIEYDASVDVPGVEGGVQVNYYATREDRAVTFRIDGKKDDQRYIIELRDDGPMGILSDAYKGIGKEHSDARDDLRGKSDAGEHDMRFENVELFNSILLGIDQRFDARRAKENAALDALQIAEERLAAYSRAITFLPQSALLSPVLDSTINVIEEAIPAMQAYNEDPLGLNQ